jgi:hypothetical protein
MRPITEMTADELHVAREAAETLMRFRAYLPPGGLLLMLVSKFRGDTGDPVDVERGGLPRRGLEHCSLDELTSVELDTVTGATGILLQTRFTAVMADPALPRLLGEYRDALNRQKTERAEIRASIGAS